MNQIHSRTQIRNAAGYCNVRNGDFKLLCWVLHVPNVKDILIKAVFGEDFSNDFESVTKFYHDDLDPHRLSPQLTC